MTIEMKLAAIYGAAHHDIPAQATSLGAQGTAVSGGTAASCGEIEKVGHALSGSVFSLGDEVVVRLRQVTSTMNDCATALDRIADDFARTDGEAADWLAAHRAWLDEHGYGGDPPRSDLPEPPKAR